MAIVPIRNLGGGSGGEAKPKYLYKDGTQNVEWDNGLYNLDTGATLDGGFTLNSSNMSASVSSAGHCRTIITKNVVDLSEYSKLVVIYNATNTLSVDISSLKIGGYVWVDANKNGGAQNCIYLGVSSQKDFMLNNAYASKNITSITFPLMINRIWLEK